MPLEVVIVDGGGSGVDAQVTRAGALAVVPAKFDETKFVELAEPNTAYNFYLPLPGQQFVITGLYYKADRQVSNTVDADVIIYESDDVDSTTVDKVLHEDAMIRGESAVLTPLNILVAEAVWVNAKTTDDDIHMTIFGYYIAAVK